MKKFTLATALALACPMPAVAADWTEALIEAAGPDGGRAGCAGAGQPRDARDVQLVRMTEDGE